MNLIKWILDKLNGKKTSIVALITTTTAFLTLKGIVDMDTQVYIDTVILILAFGANYTNYKMQA